MITCVPLASLGRVSTSRGGLAVLPFTREDFGQSIPVLRSSPGGSLQAGDRGREFKTPNIRQMSLEYTDGEEMVKGQRDSTEAGTWDQDTPGTFYMRTL